MNGTPTYFKSQYQLIQQSRSALFDYCMTITNEDFLNQNNSFGRGGSIRNLLVHIVNTYEFWIIKQALKKDIAYTEYAAINKMDEIEKLFNSVDTEILNFLGKFESSEFETIKMTVNGNIKNITPFELFTHVITHEFHHKGQILSLSRHLGYLPIDTDVIR
jgi:uncharacterized damage-inducible protein DinB